MLLDPPPYQPELEGAKGIEVEVSKADFFLVEMNTPTGASQARESSGIEIFCSFRSKA